MAGADHVLIGRAEGVERDFALLRGELEKALGKILTRPEGQGRPPRRKGDTRPAPKAAKTGQPA